MGHLTPTRIQRQRTMSKECTGAGPALDRSARDQLIQEHIGFAQFMARQFFFSGIEWKDLQSMAYEGLIRAADHYNPALGFQFTTFAGRVIKNEILSELRRLKRQSGALSLDQLVESNTLGTPTTFMETLRADALDVDHRLTTQCVREVLTEALTHLTRCERSVIALRYLGDDPYTRPEIAEKLHITRAAVQSIEHLALDKLFGHINGKL